MGFLKSNLMNFRGGDILALAKTLAERGFELQKRKAYDPSKWPAKYHTDDDGNALAIEDSGDFTITDPDGNALYFDSVPIERARYRAGDRYCTAKTEVALVDGLPKLESMVYHLPVKDLATSKAFYERLGLSVLSEDGKRCAMGNGLRIPFRITLCAGEDKPWIALVGAAEPGERTDPDGQLLRFS
jgi:hypothetical protein